MASLYLNWQQLRIIGEKFVTPFYTCFLVVWQFRYSLYSTTSCFSCRAFFRRSLVGNKYETFSCRSVSEAKTCQVTATNRKKCQARPHTLDITRDILN